MPEPVSCLSYVTAALKASQKTQVLSRVYSKIAKAKAISLENGFSHFLFDVYTKRLYSVFHEAMARLPNGLTAVRGMFTHSWLMALFLTVEIMSVESHETMAS